jgi:hypothetical protein
MIMVLIRSVKWLASPSMRVWQQKCVNVRSWNDCVAISLLRIRKTPGADLSGNGEARVEDTLPGWDNACHILVAGIHDEVNRAGA